ncbi:MAG: glucose-6-phosphate isomerase [Defluviitaleaceae bacterium]|nr:glucose-6-phosphate isomerase [Defluviitaleaceae bacterium]
MATTHEQLRLDYNNMMAEFVGEHGFSPDDIQALSAKVRAATAAMKDKRAKGLMDWRDLPHNQAAVADDILAYVASKADGFEAFVVLGIGGSALGPMAVQQAINHPYYNELPREKRGGFPKFYVVDNVDPERLVYLFNIIEPEKCLFNVISKSGSTSETMSQFMIIKQMLEDKLGQDARRNIVCTTDSEKGNLIKIAKQEGYKTFIIPSGVGGRFSELTPVGLLPAAFAGIDIRALLAGAAFMDKMCEADDISQNSAHMYGLLNYIAMQKAMPMSVMMPYADSLKFIADWYAQLWAESLGKKFDNGGNVVNVGPTPVKALGVTDQHSQVQLYVEGPYDKIVVFIGVDEYRETVTIPTIYGDIPSLGFLGGVTHNRLITAMQHSTEYALMANGRPNMTITLPRVNEFTLGQLLYFFEVATGFAGELLNIDAFDQPGVEEGKNATYAMFGRPGYEDKKKELDARPAKKDSYVI